MSTYLDHGGAEREQALARLWAELELRLARDGEVRIEHLHVHDAAHGCGWGDDHSTLIVALSGHAYRRVLEAVEQVVDHRHQPAQQPVLERRRAPAEPPAIERRCAPSEPLEQLRLAYALLRASRELATQVGRQLPPQRIL